ncbi:MAG: SRPBCC domain-containing protein [Pseudomonadota bacterium]
MNHYQHTMTLKASPAAVYAALTTAEGLRAWWTEDCDIATAVGGELAFRFGAHHKEMRIERMVPCNEVQWLCTGAHIEVDSFTRKDEWVGTRIVFHLAQDGDSGTRVRFDHVGLVPAFECYGVCSEGWQHFLSSLEKYVETGHGTPYHSVARAPESTHLQE